MADSTWAEQRERLREMASDGHSGLYAPETRAITAALERIDALEAENAAKNASFHRLVEREVAAETKALSDQNDLLASLLAASNADLLTAHTSLDAARAVVEAARKAESTVDVNAYPAQYYDLVAALARFDDAVKGSR